MQESSSTGSMQLRNITLKEYIAHVIYVQTHAKHILII